VRKRVSQSYDLNNYNLAIFSLAMKPFKPSHNLESCRSWRRTGDEKIMKMVILFMRIMLKKKSERK
jgi:hypothetical protein